MKRSMKNILLAVLLLSLLVMTFAVLSGCEDAGDNGGNDQGDGEVTVSKIYIKDAEKPQLTFILGAEPNFSAGKLTVEKSDATTETVALNAEGVTVSGYQKDTLGEQTVTFTYQGKTTTLKVNVVRRMVFKSLNLKYFVGDVFDKSIGNVRVTLDDGKAVTLNMNDAKLSVEGFDSAKPGTQEVTVRYTSDGVSYTDTVSVKVYDLGNMKLKTPGKLLYKSHDTELKIADAYLTVTASDDNTMTKHVPLNTEGVKITGFDPTKATRENANTPLSQQITVEYLGQTFTFNISITYSAVSIMRDAAKELKDIDWSAEEISITPEQGDLALEVMPLYFDMSASDREYLTEEQIDAIVKVAAAYGADHYTVVAKEFADAFELILRMDNKGNYLWTTSPTGKSYEAVVTAFERLNDPEDEFLVLSTLLTNIKNSFGKDIIYDDVAIEQIILVLGEDWIQFTSQVLDHMIKLHKDLSTIPTDWTVASLEGAAEISAAVYRMNIGYSQYINYVAAIGQVSSWREKNDYLEIIYTYYLNYKDDAAIANDLAARYIPFPGSLQDLYALIVNGNTMLKEFTGAGSMWKDTINFLLTYDQALELSNKIAETEGLYKEIYSHKVFNFPKLIADYLSPAYYTFCNSMYGDREFSNMYGVYMTLIRAIVEDGGLENHDIKDHYTAYQDFIDIFAALSPAKQKGFLGTLYYLYHVETTSEYMLFDYSKVERGTFVTLFKLYMQDRLPEEMVNGIAQDLWLAIEYYINIDRYDNALASFMDKMAAVETTYNTMSDEDRATFNTVFERVYTRYKALYAFEKDKAAGEEIGLGEYAAILEELRVTLGQTQKLLDMILDETNGAQNQKYIFLLLAAQEKSSSLISRIIASNNNYVVGTYYNTVYELSESVKSSLDDAFISYRLYFVNILRGATFGVMDDAGKVTYYYAWNQYANGEVGNFFSENFDTLYAFFLDEATVTAEQLAKVKSGIAALKGNDFFLLRSLIGGDLYIELVAAFSEGAVKEMAEKMQSIAEAHSAYVTLAGKEGVTKEEIAAALATYQTAVDAAAELSTSLAENEDYKTFLKSLHDQFVLILESAQKSQAEAA